MENKIIDSDEDEKSLYEIISSAVVNGELPQNFSLPKDSEDTASKWVDGAFDGISLYHFPKEALTEDKKERIIEAINFISVSYSDATDVFTELVKNTRALSMVDFIQEYILSHRDTLFPSFFRLYAWNLVQNSDNTELVKIGLSLFEFFELTEDEKNIVRTLALSDEFTFFAIFSMRLWENSNNEIFEIAKKVYGWGRIHAVNYLKPDTPEIQEWFLNDAVHNNITSSYSALECWKKSNAEALLKSNLSREKFSAIRDIIEGLVEMPEEGLSLLDNSEEIIFTFLEKAREQNLSDEDIVVVQAIHDYYNDEENNNPEITKFCTKIIEKNHKP